jgi:hypothetical protein
MLSDDLHDAEEDDGITCDCACLVEKYGTHSFRCKDYELPTPTSRGSSGKGRRGWTGKMPVALDGNNWPLDFAAKMIGCSEKDLRDLVRMTGLKPAGTLRMSEFRRSGRNPRAYDASTLVRLWQGIQDLADNLEED